MQPFEKDEHESSSDDLESLLSDLSICNYGLMISVAAFSAILLFYQINPHINQFNTTKTSTNINYHNISDNHIINNKCYDNLSIDDVTNPPNINEINKYFGEIYNETELALSEMSKYISLLNVYEIHFDEQLDKLRHMWLVSIYDNRNDIYWVISRTLGKTVQWIISIYANNSFTHKLANDKIVTPQLLTGENTNLAEPRLFHLNKYTIVATVHNRGIIAALNFSDVIVQPTKNNNFSAIAVSKDRNTTFNDCKFQKSGHKNWSPIVMNDTLYFIVQHEPLTIVSCPAICAVDCVIVFIETLPKNKYPTANSILRGGSQYIPIAENIYVGFLHSHIKTNVSLHKSIYRGHLSVVNMNTFEILYISEPLIWNWNNVSSEIKWQESSPTGIVQWDIITDNNNNICRDVMYISWCIGGINNGGEYWEIITKQIGFYKFIMNGIQFGFNQKYIHHSYWEERVKKSYLDFFNVRLYDKIPTGDKWIA